MATKAIAATKTVLSFSVDGTTFTPLSALKTISYGGSKLSFIDVTNMDSPGDYKEQIPSIFDGGEVTLAGVYVSGDTARLAAITAYTGKTLCLYKIQIPKATGQTTAGDTVTFSGYFASIGTDFDYTKEVTFSSTIDITGPVVYTTGS